MNSMASTERHILHVDMDAFYAAIEQHDHPELRGKPVLVGGSPQSRGVVSTASYEARPFGCDSAMPMAQAIRLCPQAVVIPPRMERYLEVSRQVFEILEQFTPLVEPLSIDEAFLDATGSIRLLGPAERIARGLRQRILQATGLTASVGVAPNKFIAKLASDQQKPDGLVVVQAGEVRAFLDPLPISCLWGVGRATLPRFEQLGIRTFGDARRLSEPQLQDHFGEAGAHFFRLVRGIDDRPVVTDREARSISHEVTFPEDVQDRDRLRAVLLEQTEQVARRLRRHSLRACTIVLKLRLPDFTTLTRRTTLDTSTDQTEILWNAAAMLFEEWAQTSDSPLRLLDR
ncbi:MAG: DNA polymerase IV, partial [Nitrospirae bacterium]